ncbi:MAG: transcription-repair coupling factor [Deltaproteobacteria bacterium]|jgi:transcription-repair coupling factor (superfamily II helicase)|nr:transcription-repair coupling factor [Deltaproteobacteria bacterium]MBW2496233.1 transcription-repair coupling factor [Deltaproteobacteria bacterium]
MSAEPKASRAASSKRRPTRRGDTPFDQLLRKAREGEGLARITGLRGASNRVAASHLIRAHGDRPVLYVTPHSRASDVAVGALRALLGERDDRSRLQVFPRHDTLPFDRFSPQPFLVSQRMAVLHRLDEAAGEQAEPAPIIVASRAALALRLPSRTRLRAQTRRISVGEALDRDALVARLVGQGYQRMALVEEPGEVAVRGDIVDVFPPQLPAPLRIELWGDEVDSIRSFDPASQRSQERGSTALLPPPRELLFERDEIIERSSALRAEAEAQEIPPAEVDALIDGLLRGHVPPGAESLAPLIQPDQESFFDYLPEETLILVEDPEDGVARIEHVYEEIVAHHEAARGERLTVPLDDLMLDPQAVARSLEERGALRLERLDVVEGADERGRLPLEMRSQDELRRELVATRSHDRALEPLVTHCRDWLAERWRVVIVCGSLSSAERLRTLLAEYELEAQIASDPRPIWHWSLPGRLELRVATLGEGFIWPEQGLVLITDEEIFGHRERRRQTPGWREGQKLEGIAQLAPGDFLVHADHGIGVYRGLVELAAGGRTSELLAIEYLAGDKLFLPIDRLSRVQRYGAADGVQPRIDKLGGETWEKTRRKVKASLRDMAGELLALHAARELAPGFAFSARDALLEEFEAGFPYEETPDQLAAIDDVLGDMRQARPMDRLVCGDVGYGKTEVAIRAAFRAAADGKQVVVLTPTTVLCQQHFENFEARFRDHPIRVEMLSRFCTPKQSRETLEGLATGSVDIVIATHRILQKNVQFKDLGLLVVDEEQRFGVSHKEKIKKLRKTVDVLTLTATPIPRTLQMAFTGIRDLSVIETPPVDRLAIRTQVCRFDEGLIREAILREIRRGGQVFFLHNRVRTIGAVQEMLERIAPEVRVMVAHGQMKERDLEDRIHGFLRKEADVLVCTTIIESGIDMPNVNTIFVGRADTLGLSQLYQLRGRVGRSKRRAYAYLMIPIELGSLSADAQKRLEAIQDLSELGAGFRLANLDLEIRGAGDLLGLEQSGNLRSVGYETYMEMLEETIDELRGQVHEEWLDPEIKLPVEGRLPEDYVPDVSQRLVLYKRLSSARDENEVALIRDELLDRFGRLPREAENLIEVIRLKIGARRLGIARIEMLRGELVLQVAARSQIDPNRLVQLLSHARAGLRITPEQKIVSKAPGPEGGAEALFEATRSLLGKLAGP